MSLLDIVKYNNTLVANGDNVTLSEVYGKEKFCYLVYSLVKMQQPETILVPRIVTGKQSIIILNYI